MTGEEIRNLLTKLASVYPALDQSPEAKRRVLEAWEWALADADATAILAAARRWVRDRPQYPPRPGDLLALSGETRALIDPALYGRYGQLRRQLQVDGSLPPDLCEELANIERRIGLQPGETVSGWQGSGAASKEVAHQCRICV